MKALILVDLQYDFMPGGALGVAEGDAVVPVANALQPAFELVIATQDWHPETHGSFAANHPGKKPGDVVDLDGIEQILWPVHCVQGSHGAELVAQLDRRKIAHVVQKGTDPAIDSYSAFFDNAHRKQTPLHDLLQGHGVEEIYLAGLATDYCVNFTGLDGLKLGYRVTVVEDGCRGVNLRPDDSRTALDHLHRQGARVVKSADVLS